MQTLHGGGIRQTMHTVLTVLNEPEDMVRECTVRLLVAPEPAFMEHYIWVCDDGHDRIDGPRKRAVVTELRALGAPIAPLRLRHASNSLELGAVLSR